MYIVCHFETTVMKQLTSAYISKMVYVAVFLLSLLAHQSSALYPHQQRSFLGRGLPLNLQAQAGVSDPPYTVGHVTQKVDHFNTGDTRTFSQRYLVLDEYWDKEGPLFVYTGNEGDIVWFFQNSVSAMVVMHSTHLSFLQGFVVEDLSQHFNALIIFIEHRYYGQSLPFGADSYKDAQHLQYLNSQQALADFASAITELKVRMQIIIDDRITLNRADAVQYIQSSNSGGRLLWR